MRVLFVVQAYHPSLGGVQWLVRNLAERLVRSGSEVGVFTTTALQCRLFSDPTQASLPAGEEEIHGVRVRRFPVYNRFPRARVAAARWSQRLRLPGREWLRGLHFGPIVPGLAGEVAGSGADLVVASSFPMIHMYDALAGGRRAGVPVVLVGAVHPADAWGYDLARTHRAVAAADAYVALSGAERDHLIGRGAPADRVELIGAGVDAAAFSRPAVEDAAGIWRAERGWGEDPVVLMLGRQTAYKRADLVIDAMERVWPEHPEARLLIAGERSDGTPALLERIEGLAADRRERVALVGNFVEEEKPVLCAVADLLVQPSERESFGLVFLEAWAAGRPVIGTRTGAAPTVIADGDDGLLATYGDAGDWAAAIGRLLAGRELRRRLGEQGRQKVWGRYTWREVARRFQALCERVAATR